jgi:hypothetical protein
MITQHGPNCLSIESKLLYILQVAYEFSQGVPGSDALTAAAAALSSIVQSLVGGGEGDDTAVGGEKVASKRVLAEGGEIGDVSSGEDKERVTGGKERVTEAVEASPAVTRGDVIDRVMEVRLLTTNTTHHTLSQTVTTLSPPPSPSLTHAHMSLPR